MLMDLLGALMGFISVILLLSLIVTGLAQVIQSTLRLRGRNLYAGLQVLLRKIRTKDDVYDSSELAYQICNSTSLMPIKGQIFPSSIPFFSENIPIMPKEIRLPWLTGIARTRIEKDELIDALAEEAGIDISNTETEEFKKLEEKVEKYYPRLEKSLEKRFKYTMHNVSFFCSFAVAVAFQISSPQLLSDLTTNPEMREKYLQLAEGTLEYAEGAISRLAEYEDLSGMALNQLQEVLKKEEPELSMKLEAVSGIGESKEDTYDEFEIVLQDLDPEERQRVAAHYDEIFDELNAKMNSNAREEIRNAANRLATVNIEPWPHGPEFYYSKSGPGWENIHPEWSNILGVLMTAILLTFGAPFWFQRLKEVANLRDALSPKEKQNSNKNEAGKNLTSSNSTS